MNGRLSEEFRGRTKLFAAQSIRLYVKLPKDREEVRVCGKQMLRAGTSVAAHVREECGIAPTDTLPLEKEADELMAIMTTMINKTKGKNRN